MPANQERKADNKTGAHEDALDVQDQDEMEVERERTHSKAVSRGVSEYFGRPVRPCACSTAAHRTRHKSAPTLPLTRAFQRCPSHASTAKQERGDASKSGEDGDASEGKDGGKSQRVDEVLLHAHPQWYSGIRRHVVAGPPVSVC